MSFNPYEAPLACNRAVGDGPSREEFAVAMEATFVDAESVAKFDRMVTAGLRADDNTIRFVATEISDIFCEDGITEWSDLSKHEWDYFQRLILVLRANCDVETQSQYKWGVVGAASATITSLSAVCILQFGIVVYPMVSGFAALCIVVYWMLMKVRPSKIDEPIYPFTCYTELSQAYRSTPFRKLRYPNAQSTHVNSWMFDALCILVISAALLVGAPIALIHTSVPWLKSTGKVKLPKLTPV